MGKIFKWPWPHRWFPPGPQTFQNAPAGKANYLREDRPFQEQQELGVICATKWLISSAVVPSWLSTLSLGKSLGCAEPSHTQQWWSYSQWPDESFVGCLVDDFTQGPHLLNNPPPHIQANFCSQSPQSTQEKPWERRSLVSLQSGFYQWRRWRTQLAWGKI